MGDVFQFSILNPQSLSEEIAEQLSELDKMCVGADGWSADSFRSEAEKDNGYVLYVVDNENVIALLSGYSAVGEADITSIAVHPEYRRKGLALRLIERFIEMIPDDAESIFLEVRESNAPAIALYEKCGFERLSVRKNFYSQPRENAVVMQKKLNR
ncbi:MAG: ribosomal-protein-alanine N-acetyltransferase [Ruminococcus flavefaciens]|nr:ribosomal-protein-alanine N-acetyltransferase [Ruminococcus flavefaciens]